MTHKIFTFGYANSRPEALRHYLDTLGAALVDVRYRPWSRGPRWQPQALLNLAGIHRFYHVRGLGNENYKGGAVKLHAPVASLQVLRPILDKQPVILLCVCADWRTCHRRDAAEFLAERLGVKVVHLPATPADERPQVEQLTLI